jgi:hypothetical protein
MERERLLWRISEFSEAMGVSRSKGYEICAANPELTVKIGGSRRVIVERARGLVEKLARPVEAA